MFKLSTNMLCIESVVLKIGSVDSNKFVFPFFFSMGSIGFPYSVLQGIITSKIKCWIG